MEKYCHDGSLGPTQS